MGITYSPASPTLLEVVERLKTEHHGHLNTHEVRIEVRHSDSWFTKYSVGMPGITQRFTNASAHLINENIPLFLLAICREWWDNATETERDAEVDKCLSMCGSETDEDGGIKTFIVGPDCVVWRENHERYGAHELNLRSLVPTHFKQLDLFDEENATATENSADRADGEGTDELTAEEQETQRRLGLTIIDGAATPPIITADATDGEFTSDPGTPADVQAFLARREAEEYGATDADIPSIAASRNGRGSGPSRSRRVDVAAAKLGEGAALNVADGEAVAA